MSLKYSVKEFLDELCVQWGFCLSYEDIEQISALSPLEADQFVDVLLRAEGFIPEYEVKWKRRIKRRFIEKFGSDVIG